MATVVSVVSTAFVVASVGALLFFIHKVIWVVRYKQLQRLLIGQAAEQRRQTEQSLLPEWDEFAAKCWRVVRADGNATGFHGPEAYVDHVETVLANALHGAQSSRVALKPLLQQVVETSSTEAEQPTVHEVLRVPIGAQAAPLTASLRLAPPRLDEPEPVESSLYELNIKSRYSFIRRALVFCAGIADVVYSSQHIAKMSQYSHVPLGIIIRRLSLVVLLVTGIILEVVVGLRSRLEPLLQEHVLSQWAWTRGLDDKLGGNLASVAMLLLWTGTIASIYFTLFLLLRRRHRKRLKALEQLQRDQPRRLADIRQKHLTELVSWAEGYGQTLDAAVELTATHITMLGRHYASRVRRRLCTGPLVRWAQRISDRLFRELPECEGKLQDKVTTEKHSFRHLVWPRAKEMQPIIEIARYREAWQRIELTLNELRRGQPAPEGVSEFWRQLVISAEVFRNVLPEDTLSELRAGYLSSVEQISEQTGKDVQTFGHATRELVGHLDEQLSAATPLLRARIELANRRIRAAVGKYEAEVIRAREQARLESIAFEL